MINNKLSNWISDSEAWQAKIDFDVQIKQDEYEFLKRPDDFFISLFIQLKEKLDVFFQDKINIKKDLLSIAKGLEIYSLEKKKENFYGVSYSKNILYVASLYYLTDYPATALLILKQFNKTQYETEIEQFLYFFLSRNFSIIEVKNNHYFKNILKFLLNGDKNEIFELKEKIESELKTPEIHKYMFYHLSNILIKNFEDNNIWNDLLKHNLIGNWKEFVKFNIKKNPPFWSFFPSQKEAIENGILSFTKAFSLQTPTSSGKTTISELVIYNEIKNNPDCRVLYLAPFRALASELKKNLGRNLTKFKFKVRTIYGGNIISEFDKTSIEHADVLISTPEKFMAIENNIKGTLDNYNLVICDEGHLIDDKSRGVNYELLLSRLKLADNGSKKFLFLSAIIPNIEIINSWLGGSITDIARSNYRPTEIELAYLNNNNNNNNKSFNLIVNPLQEPPRKYVLTEFLSQKDFQKKIPTTFKSKAAACGLKAMNSGAVAIFATTKDDRQGVAGIAEEVLNFTDTQLPKPINFADSETVKLLSEYFNFIFSDKYLLSRSIIHGFIFHHGDLPQFIREIIEDVIRKQKIRLIICTNTIAEGVNLPIKTMVISSAKRFDKGFKKCISLNIRTLKNLIGRTGRAGKESKGTIIVVNPNDRSTLNNVFENKGLENVKGFLYQVIIEIEDHIKKNETPLNNELLDQLEQSDLIDDSIIQLLAEDIELDNLSETVKVLVETTLTFYQADEKQKNNIYTLFNLRTEKLQPFIKSGKFFYIKNSGIPLRKFNVIEEIVDYNQELLGNVSDPINNDWLNFLFNILISINPNYEDPKFIKAINVWISGGWYKDIANVLNISIEESLKFLNMEITYRLQNDASRIIKYIEIKRKEADLETSNIILLWTNYLIYGFRSQLELDLTEIGISDRICAIAIAKWVEEKSFSYNDQFELRTFILSSKIDILNDIKPDIPKYSHIELSNFLNKTPLN